MKLNFTSNPTYFNYNIYIYRAHDDIIFTNTTKHGMKCHFTTKAIHILPIIYTYEFKGGKIQMKEKKKKKKEHSES